jgi:hypothetical protein
VTKILNGGGGLSDELINGASHLFLHAAIFSAYGISSYHRILIPYCKFCVIMFTSSSNFYAYKHQSVI